MAAFESTQIKPTIFETGTVRESFVSPDGIQAIHFHSREDKMLVLTNRGNIPFMVSVATCYRGERRILTNIVYDPVNHNVRINDRWVVSDFSIRNEINSEIAAGTTPPLVESHFLSLVLHPSNFNSVNTNRIDFRIRSGHFAAVKLSPIGLMQVRFNGNYLMNRFRFFTEDLSGVMENGRLPVAAGNPKEAGDKNEIEDYLAAIAAEADNANEGRA